MDDARTCYYCSEPIEPGTTKCPFCGEALGKQALAKRAASTGWGSPGKPMTIAVIGWLSVVFGAFGVFGVFSSAVMFLVMGNNPIFAQSWGPPGSGQRVIMFVATALGGVVSTINLTGGVGLLRMRLWGRNVALGVAIYSIVASLIMPFFTMKTSIEAAKASGTETFVYVTVAVGMVIGFAIQGAIIFFLTRPHVGAALQKAEGARA